MSGPLVFSGASNPDLAKGVCAHLGVPLGRCEIGRFPDGEQAVTVLESVRGRDVYLVQPTSPPAEEHLFALLLLADACRRAGAARLTAVMPYFGYARQDRRAQGREPVAARLVADLLATAGFERILAVDLHGRGVEAIFSMPLEHLSAVPLLIDAVRDRLPPDSVVVAPDLGATKLAEKWSRALDLPTAIVHKHRVTGAEVTVRGVTGDVKGRAPLIIDDLVSTGGTLAAAAHTVLEHGARPEVTICATHALLVGAARDVLGALPLVRFLATDTVLSGVTRIGSVDVETTSVAPLLAEAIRRLNAGDSLHDLLKLG